MKDLHEIKFEGKVKGHAGMTVPENFFAEFDKQLEAKLDSLTIAEAKPSIAEQPVIGQRSNSRWLRYTSIAASVVAVVVVGLFAMNIDQNTQVEPTATQLAEFEQEESNMEEMMMIGSMSDLDIYEYYCNY